MEKPSQEVFEKLFRHHHRELCNLAYNLCGNQDLAKDVVQEVFMKLWKNKDTIDFTGPVKHYLFKATSHTALNQIRSSRKNTALDDDVAATLIAHAATHEHSYTELEEKVRQAIERLPQRCRMIYQLSRHEGLKYQQIAETLDISIKTVENQMGIALEKLRNELKPFLTREFLSILLLASVSVFRNFL